MPSGPNVLTSKGVGEILTSKGVGTESRQSKEKIENKTKQKSQNKNKHKIKNKEKVKNKTKEKVKNEKSALLKISSLRIMLGALIFLAQFSPAESSSEVMTHKLTKAFNIHEPEERHFPAGTKVRRGDREGEWLCQHSIRPKKNWWLEKDNTTWFTLKTNNVTLLPYHSGNSDTAEGHGFLSKMDDSKWVCLGEIKMRMWGEKGLLTGFRRKNEYTRYLYAVVGEPTLYLKTEKHGLAHEDRSWENPMAITIMVLDTTRTTDKKLVYTVLLIDGSPRRLCVTDVTKFDTFKTKLKRTNLLNLPVREEVRREEQTTVEFLNPLGDVDEKELAIPTITGTSGGPLPAPEQTEPSERQKFLSEIREAVDELSRTSEKSKCLDRLTTIKETIINHTGDLVKGVKDGRDRVVINRKTKEELLAQIKQIRRTLDSRYGDTQMKVIQIRNLLSMEGSDYMNIHSTQAGTKSDPDDAEDSEDSNVAESDLDGVREQIFHKSRRLLLSQQQDVMYNRRRLQAIRRAAEHNAVH